MPQATLSDEEPRFLFFNRNRDEVPSVEEVWDEDHDVQFDPAEEEADHIIRGYEEAMDFLEDSDEDLMWAEEHQETAPVISVCSTCSASVQTNSKERLESKQYTHHVGTGH